MAIPPDTGTARSTTPNTHLWTAPRTPTLYAGAAPPPAPRVTTRAAPDRACLASFHQTRPPSPGHRHQQISQRPTGQNPIGLCLLTRWVPLYDRCPSLPTCFRKKKSKPFPLCSRTTLFPPPLQVSRNDTLAGVALKYGISATELRRANQLWASDSIHLRRVLYVPLDKARHADLETVASLLARRTEGGDTARAPSPASHIDPQTSDSSPIVQRIPSSSFSFFPPPTSRASTPPPGTSYSSVSSTTPFHSRAHSPATVSTPPRVPSLASNLRSTAISSFFSILPINASTRDEIMSRLSVDSVSNSTTGTASDEDEHELTTVPATPKLRASASASTSAAPLAMGSRRRKSPPRTWLSRSSDPSGYREPYARDVEQIALASSPIHTTQMQPAPTMQLPQSMSRSPSKGTPPNDPPNGDWRLSGGDHGRIR